MVVAAGGSPFVTSGTQDNKWLKIIACDQNGDPLITMDQRLTIRADTAVAALMKYTGGERVMWVGFEFDGNGSTATDTFVMKNADMSTQYHHHFYNCKFIDGNNYIFKAESDARCVVMIDCETDDVSGTSWYALRIGTVGFYAFNCIFRGQYYLGGCAYPSSSDGNTFDHCVFDGKNIVDYSIYNSGYYTQNFLNCVFTRYQIDAIRNASSGSGINCRNCRFDPETPASDGVASMHATAASKTVNGFGCVSTTNLRLLDAANLDVYVPDPYRSESDWLHDNDADAGCVDSANKDYRGKDPVITCGKGVTDYYGIPTVVGAQGVNMMAEMKRRRLHG